MRATVALLVATLTGGPTACQEDASGSSLAATAVPTFDVRSYGADLADGAADDAAFAACLQAAIAASGICHVGAGTLWLTHSPSVLQRPSTQTANVDARNLVIEGEGAGTTVKGVSPEGFDVFQLNAVSRLTIRNLTITAVKTSTSTKQGVNGVSMTNGTSSVLIENVVVKGLPFVSKDTYIDGGKAFTIQQGTKATVASTGIEVRLSQSVDNPTGFGLDVDPNLTPVPGTMSFHNNTVTNALYGAALSFVAKTGGGTDVPGFSAQIVNNKFTNVKHPLVISRAPYVTFKGNTVTTNTFPSYRDFFLYPSVALAVIGGRGAQISGNTVKVTPPVTAMLLCGGTNNAAYTENAVVSQNTFTGAGTFGVQMVTQAGAATRQSSFTRNRMTGFSTPYDPALKSSSLHNLVQ